MGFVLNVSKDGRVRTQMYLKDGIMMFCLGEPVARGTLITEFDSDCQVASQTYSKKRDAVSALKEYFGITECEFVDSGEYKGMRVNAKCKKCGQTGLVRELDLLKPSEIAVVPVIPIFLCAACKHRHYSLTDRYLKTLVTGNRALFEESELKEIDTNKESSVRELHEYIIRIFASKKISKIEIK